MSAIKRSALRVASALLPAGVADCAVARLSGRSLKRELTDRVTDGFLEALLGSMEVAFALSGSYRKNIEGFDAVFVFRTRDNAVGATAVFRNGCLSVESQPRPAFDTRLTFRDAEGLSGSLLAGDSDILNTMMTNPVEVDGNLSCLYRFGYLARELTLRLGVG